MDTDLAERLGHLRPACWWSGTKKMNFNRDYLSQEPW